MKVWQILPLGPAGHGNSPYSGTSAFAGNPMLLSPERLREDGLLAAGDIEDSPRFPADRVDFGRVVPWKEGILRKSWESFRRRPPRRLKEENEAFASDPGRIAWLEDWALYSALKESFGGKSWTRWPPELAQPRAGGDGEGPAGSRRGDGLPPLPPVPLLPAVGAGEAGGEPAGDPGDGRPPPLRGLRQRRCLGQPAPLRPGRGPPPQERGGGPAGLLQRDGAAVGEPSLPLGSHGRRGVRMVDCPGPGEPPPGRHPAHRPLSRPGGLLGDSGRGADGGRGNLAPGPRRRPLPGSAPGPGGGPAGGGRPGDHHR